MWEKALSFNCEAGLLKSDDRQSDTKWVFHPIIRRRILIAKVAWPMLLESKSKRRFAFECQVADCFYAEPLCFVAMAIMVPFVGKDMLVVASEAIDLEFNFFNLRIDISESNCGIPSALLRSAWSCFCSSFRLLQFAYNSALASRYFTRSASNLYFDR
jgi:hypothetical protein